MARPPLPSRTAPAATPKPAGAACVNPHLEVSAMPDRTNTDRDAMRIGRQQHIAGLRDLADWLEANPAVPVHEFDCALVQRSVDVFVKGLAEQRAEVDRIAEAMGVEAVESLGHYKAIKDFGPVRYQAVSCQDDEEATS